MAQLHAACALPSACNADAFIFWAQACQNLHERYSQDTPGCAAAVAAGSRSMRRRAPPGRRRERAHPQAALGAAASGSKLQKARQRLVLDGVDMATVSISLASSCLTQRTSLGRVLLTRSDAASKHLQAEFQGQEIRHTACATATSSTVAQFAAPQVEFT